MSQSDDGMPTGRPDFLAPGHDQPSTQPLPPPETPPPVTDIAAETPTRSSHKLFLVVGLVVVVAILAAAGLMLGLRTTATGNCPPDTICVTVTKILNDYGRDMDAAQAKYQGQNIAVTGTLDAFQNDTGYYTAILTAKGMLSNGPYVGCRDLPYNDIQAWQNLHPNNWNVTLTGLVVTGSTGSRGVFVVLRSCHLKLS